MKLFQVRKGQFVYYENELHKVFAVRPMSKKSVHLFRLKDMQESFVKAPDIELHKPKDGESFIFYGKRYTIDAQDKPEEGDYILIVKPSPDFLDHYSLNEIEKVESVEDGNVVTTRDNGVKHSEYVVLQSGFLEGGRDIAYKDPTLVSDEQKKLDESIEYLVEHDENLQPSVGDIYLDVHNNTKAMIVGMTEDELIFGHGLRVHMAELLNEDNYQLVYEVNRD